MKTLRIIPLGGLGEIGKNMTVLEYGRDMIVVDCGVMFPDSDLPGIDLVLPQFDYVVRNQDRLRGVVLTHGHMDHIGGLPYLFRSIKTGLYGTALTLGLAKRQLQEARVLQQAQLHILQDRDTFQLGPFKISLFPVAHSIPGSVGLVIDTPVGAIVHTGDYKLDATPSGGRTTDLAHLRKLTPNGVLALLGDSTNADKPGRTPSEQLVAAELDRLFTEARHGRLIIATFASLLGRLEEILRLAQKHGRKVMLTGRSLEDNIAVAGELGEITIPRGLLVEAGAKVPDDKLLILATGVQGEPRSALNRMALGEHRQISVKRGDTIIVSGGTIPGNETEVGRMLNKLFELGANVIYGKLANVHVSGHGSRDEQAAMLKAARPKFFLPVHGETRHLHLHAQMAHGLGLSPENVFVLHNGDVWATDGRKAWLDQAVTAGDVLVDGGQVGEVSPLVMRDRQQMSQDGLVLALIPVDARNRLAGEPELTSRGVVEGKGAQAMLNAARGEIKRLCKAKAPTPQALEKGLQEFLYREMQSRPVIVVSFVPAATSARLKSELRQMRSVRI